MNKTLALIAALGLVVSAPAFAADEDATTTTPAVKAETATPSKTEIKGTKDKTALKVKESKTKEAKDATTTGKTEGKSAKAAAASDLAPSAGGSKFDKSEEKTDTSKQ